MTKLQTIAKQMEQIIAKHIDAVWTVVHTTNENNHYTDIYKANGKPVFQLSWWDTMSKPYWKIF